MTLEPLTKAHCESPALKGKLPPFHLLELQVSMGAINLAVIEMNQPIGVAMLSVDNECMVHISDEFQKRGFGTQSLIELVDRAFTEKNIDKVTATTQPNRPGAKLVTKVGFIEISRSGGEIYYELTRK